MSLGLCQSALAQLHIELEQLFSVFCEKETKPVLISLAGRKDP